LAVPLRARKRGLAATQTYEARLALGVRDAGSGAPLAAMRLLEYLDPPTLQAALVRLDELGALSVEAFDFLADAWETYRHLRHQSWD
jgi:hypothetical protein